MLPLRKTVFSKVALSKLKDQLIITSTGNAATLIDTLFHVTFSVYAERLTVDRK